jgi:hypothetical protein
MKQSPARQPHSLSRSRNFSPVVAPSVHRRFCNSSPTDPTVSQVNPVHTLLSYFLKTHFSNTRLFTTRSFRCSLISYFAPKTLPRFKIINNKITEQRMDFIYFGSHVSPFEHQKDIHRNLMKCNKLKGNLRRNFGKQMRKDIQIRLHNAI